MLESSFGGEEQNAGDEEQNIFVGEQIFGG